MIRRATPKPSLTATRIGDGPIVSPDSVGWDELLVGRNVNGPSLIRAPRWLADPPGRYLLYFAHHQGKSIRLAFADDLAGPWAIHTPGTLQLSDTPFRGHIASPDLHVDDERQQLIMVYHGYGGVKAAPRVEQPAAVATSEDGLHWTHTQVLDAESYLRAFDFDGRRFGIAKAGRLYEATAGGFDFDRSWGKLDISGRHWAALTIDGRLHLLYSRWGDAPEHILHATVDTSHGPGDWWIDTRESLLIPECPWEGSEFEAVPSRNGSIHEPVCELRDPAVFTDDDGQRYLLYSVAGEAGIALASLTQS